MATNGLLNVTKPAPGENFSSTAGEKGKIWPSQLRVVNAKPVSPIIAVNPVLALDRATGTIIAALGLSKTWV